MSVTRTPTGAIRVLFVEDDTASAQSTVALLNAAAPGEFRVDYAGTLSEALQVLQEASKKPGGLPAVYDVILLDLILPNGEGMAVLQSVVSAAPQTAVVILTGINNVAVVKKAMELPTVWDYLLKGHLDAETLTQALRYAVGRLCLEHRMRAALATLAAAEAMQCVTLATGTAPPGSGRAAG
jgi:response regulator of citrate/malate metabolism